MKKSGVPGTASLGAELSRVLEPIKQNLEIIMGSRPGVTEIGLLSPAATTNAAIVDKINELVTRLNYGGVSATPATGIVTGPKSDIVLAAPLQNAAFSNGTSGGYASGTLVIPTRCACLFVASGTCWTTVAGAMYLTLSVDGVGTIAGTSWSTNETNSHKASPLIVGVQTLDAGSYTVRMTASTNSDSSDRAGVAVLGIPTL